MGQRGAQRDAASSDSALESGSDGADAKLLDGQRASSQKKTSNSSDRNWLLVGLIVLLVALAGAVFCNSNVNLSGGPDELDLRPFLRIHPFSNINFLEDFFVYSHRIDILLTRRSAFPTVVRQQLDLHLPRNADHQLRLTSAKDLTSALDACGLQVSTDAIGGTPNKHTFVTDNVQLGSEGMELVVTGGAGSGDIVQSAEVFMTTDVLYGSITTRAKASTVAGVCHGFFFYKDDNHEIDIEILTSYITEGYKTIVDPGAQYTNQALVAGGTATTTAVAFPDDPTADFHDYRIDWTQNSTKFYFDNVLQATLTTNVPTTGCPFVWNSWSSGDPNWTAGPPKENATLIISQISGSYNLAS